MPRKVFMSYRSVDTGSTAGRLAADLRRVFGEEAVFLDHRSLDPSEQWPDRLQKEVSAAAVLLVLIGKGWLTVYNEHGKRRIELQNDWVRQEIAAGLKGNGKVLPLLVNDAKPIASAAIDDLPDIVKLATAEALPLRDLDWETDTERLTDWLEKQGFERIVAHDGVTPAIPRWLSVLYANIIARLRSGQLLDPDIPAIVEGLMKGEVVASTDGAVVVLSFGHGVNVGLSEPIVARFSEALRLTLPPVRHNFPPVESTFTGRDREEKESLSVLTGHRPAAILALKGIGGVGKTALAIKVGHRLTLQFPDAQLLFDLRGTSGTPASPRTTMENVILRFYPGTQVPADDKGVLQVYRDLLRRKRVLLIFDNVRDRSQVEALLPPNPSAAIVTSREELFLSHAEGVPLDDLLLPDAMALVVKLLDGERSLSDADLRRLAQDCCFCHPLSLRVAALFLKGHRGRSVSDYIASVEADRVRLKLGRRSNDDVLAVIGQSVEQLRKEDKALCVSWRDLSVFPSGFDAAAAAAIWSIEDRSAADRLSQLEERGLVELIAEDRYRLHDLLREVAEQAWSKTRAKAVAQQHAFHFLLVLDRASKLYEQGGSTMTEGLALFDRERTNIGTGQQWASEQQRSKAAAKLVAFYGSVGASVLSLRLFPGERVRWYEAALRGALRLADLREQGVALGNLGLAHADLGETDEAIKYHKKALAISREMADPQAEAQDLGNLGIAIANLGRTREAIDYYDRAVSIADKIGDHLAQGSARNNLGFAYAHLGEPRRAIDYYEEALAFSRGNRRSEGRVLGNLGSAYADLGDVSKALEYHEQALAISREMNDRQAQSMDLDDLGNMYARLGETSKAIQLHEEGLAIARAIDDRLTEARNIRSLGALYASIGETPKAINYYEEALEIFHLIGNSRAEGDTRQKLGLALLDSNRIAARKQLQEALAIYRKIDGPRAADVEKLLVNLDQGNTG